MLLAFICSEFSLSHYLPKVRFFDTAAACLALHSGNYLPGSLSQDKMSGLWHQGKSWHQNPCAWSPAHPLFPSPPLLQNHGICQRSLRSIHGCTPASPRHHPRHCDILIKLQSHTGHRVMPSSRLLLDKLLYHNPHTLGPTLKPPYSASVKGTEPQSHAILVLKSIILPPLIIPAGLPAPLRDCHEQLSTERMSQAPAPGAQFQTKQLVKVNLVTGALSELSSFLPVMGKAF